MRDGWEYWGAGPDYAAQRGDDGLRRALGLTTDADQSLDVGTVGDVDMATWPHAVATLGVGLAPLADTSFNAAKSWLKPLEYMACGVPWVGSPRPEYRALQRLTNVGLLADQPRDWYAKIKRLMTDRVFRVEQSARGRAAVRDRNLTYEASWWRWAEQWERAMRIERGQDHAARVIA